jgi:hypothetical protein
MRRDSEYTIYDSHSCGNALTTVDINPTAGDNTGCKVRDYTIPNIYIRDGDYIYASTC